MASIIGVQELQHTNGTSAATIDSSGRILTPARPAFRATMSASQSLPNATQTRVAFNTVSGGFNFDLGGDFDTTGYYFTVPITGVYFFHASIFASVGGTRGAVGFATDSGSGFSTAPADLLAQPLTNGVSHNGGGNYSATVLVKLTSGIKVAAYAYQEQGSATTINNSAYLSQFNGYLVG